MTYRGVYDSATQYEQLDVVRYQSAAYLALTDVIGEAPSTTAKWGLIAQDGVYSAVAGTGIVLSGNTISLDSAVVNSLIATYLASVKSQTITAQSTHDQIPTSEAVYDYAAPKIAVNNINTEIQHIQDAMGDKLGEDEVQEMIEGYAASKASYTYLNNQYTQLVNDVAQLPTAPEVQQMIDSLVDPTLSVQGKAADAKATGDKLDGVPFDLTFTVNDVINNYVIVEDGKLRWNASWCSTNYCYVPLENGGTIEITSSILGGGGLAFYDYNKTCLQYITGNNASEYDYTPASMPQTRVFVVPKNTSYIRISAHKQPSSDMSRVSLLRIRKGIGLNQVVNKLESLSDDVAQLPTTADVQQMIDNSIGGVLSGEY